MGTENEDDEQVLVFEQFKHFKEVLSCIKFISKISDDIREIEELEDSLKQTLNLYLEQAHLLDPYLELFIKECIDIIKSTKNEPWRFHLVFRILYLIFKTRGYKWVIRFLPHSVEDIEPTTNLLIDQDITERDTWQTRYVLLLWLSILVMIPFSLKSLELDHQSSIVERIFVQAKRFLTEDTRTQQAASFLLARLVTRPDTVNVKLDDIISWCIETLDSLTLSTSAEQNQASGLLQMLANLCKIGRRQELLPHAPRMLEAVLRIPMEKANNILIFHMAAKLLQRIGLLFCLPRSNKWQYQHGSRSLVDNLASRLEEHKKQRADFNDPLIRSSEQTSIDMEQGSVQTETFVNDDECDLEHPEQVADVIDKLISCLRAQYTVVRWSAAKGIGRMCARFSRSMIGDVLSAVLALCSWAEPYTAWHGACLALAELGRRSLLLPSNLPEVIPVVLRSLFYDERSGDHVYGSNVRDAACYVCWAFARAYRAADFAAYVNQVASALILVSLFDREVNVRRAASAAFQENVGRQGNFPHGIDIVTACDFFAVRNRTKCFLELSTFVAGFDSYTRSMIDHLSNEGLTHWDASMRFLSARALSVLCSFDPNYMTETILPKIIPRCTESALYSRQGSIFGVAEVLLVLKNNAPISAECLMAVKKIIPTLSENNYFRGLSGELLRKACCHLIEKCSQANLPFHEDDVIDLWRLFLNDCLVHKESEVQKAAVSAYPGFLTAYLFTKSGQLRSDFVETVIQHLLSRITTNSESEQSAYLQVLANAPGSLFTNHVAEAFEQIMSATKIRKETRTWGDARGYALKAILGMTHNLGLKHSELTPEMLKAYGLALIRSLSDYTSDHRGDIGSHTREVGLEYLQLYLSRLLASGLSNLIEADFMEDCMSSIVQQAVEKIDRTRAVAGQAFAAIIYHDPPVPHILHLDQLKEIFSQKECDEMVWSSAHSTFPKFVKLLEFPEYRFRLVLGLVVSVGGLTETTVRCSSDAFTDYLIAAHDSDVSFVHELMKIVERIFQIYSHDERIILSLLKFVDFLLNNAVVCAALEGDDNSILLRLLDNTWAEVKCIKDVHRIKAAVDILGALLQFDGSVRKRALQLLLLLLCHRYPVVRKTAATKLYESLMIFELITDSEQLEDLITILTETIWESQREELRSIVNRIRALLNLPTPTVTNGPSEVNSLPLSLLSANNIATSTVHNGVNTNTLLAGDTR